MRDYHARHDFGRFHVEYYAQCRIACKMYAIAKLNTGLCRLHLLVMRVHVGDTGFLREYLFEDRVIYFRKTDYACLYSQSLCTYIPNELHFIYYV